MKRLQDAGVVDVFNAQIDRKVKLFPTLDLQKSCKLITLFAILEENTQTHLVTCEWMKIEHKDHATCCCPDSRRRKLSDVTHVIEEDL